VDLTPYAEFRPLDVFARRRAHKGRKLSLRDYFRSFERRLRLSRPSRRRLYEIREIQKNLERAVDNLARSVDAINGRLDATQQVVADLSATHDDTNVALLVCHALESLRTSQDKPLTHVPLAIYTCLPPARSGIADATWSSFREFSHPFHMFGSVDSFTQLQKLQRQLNRGSGRVFPVQAAADIRRSCNYKAHLFVLGNSQHHIPAVGEMAIVAAKTRSLAAHFHEPQMTHFWSVYFESDLEALKSFYLRFYPEHDALLRTCTSADEIAGIPCLGLRPFAASYGTSTMIFNSEFARGRAQKDLGDKYDVRLEKLFLPIFDPQPGPPPARSQPPLVVGHFGIPDIRKGCLTLIEACEIIAQTRPVTLIFCGWYADAIIARICPEPKSFIKVVDSPDDTRFNATIDEIHLAVQLRPGDTGESSAALHAVLARGKPAIVSAIGGFTDYGDAVVTAPVDVAPVALADLIVNNAAIGRYPQIRRLYDSYSAKVFHERLSDILDLS
jgi:hypothetical protein